MRLIATTTTTTRDSAVFNKQRKLFNMAYQVAEMVEEARRGEGTDYLV